MKAFTLDIHNELKGVEVTVKNGKKFSDSIILGSYDRFSFTLNEHDAERVRKFSISHGNDNSSNRGNWYAHCNGYAMDLMVSSNGKHFSINTYRPYGKSNPI